MDSERLNIVKLPKKYRFNFIRSFNIRFRAIHFMQGIFPGTFFWIVVLILFLPQIISAQNKIAFDDRANLISGETLDILKSRMQNDHFEITQTVDLKDKCGYWFANTVLIKGEIILTLLDCNDRIAGTKNLGSGILNANDPDKALLIYYALKELTLSPFKNMPEPEEEEKMEDIQPGFLLTPSLKSIEKGELVYNSLYFFLHDVKYGLNKNFSVGAGTTLIQFPLYFSPRITLPIDDVSSIGISDLLLFGTWDADFFGNLLYINYVRNISGHDLCSGMGLFHSNRGTSMFNATGPVFNLSGTGPVSTRIHYVSENYISFINIKQIAHYSFFDELSGTLLKDTDNFRQNTLFFYGQSGISIIGRKNTYSSWQLGIAYLFQSYKNIPDKYIFEGWETHARTGNKFTAFPVIGYSRKFKILE